jgi:3-isopropylmalate dehydratase small subunit
VDLPNQKIIAGNVVYEFDIDQFRKHCLVGGLDDIGLTLEKENFISRYEENRSKQMPWV